jgi:hypothetical protein
MQQQPYHYIQPNEPTAAVALGSPAPTYSSISPQHPDVKAAPELYGTASIPPTSPTGPELYGTAQFPPASHTGFAYEVSGENLKA